LLLAGTGRRAHYRQLASDFGFASTALSLTCIAHLSVSVRSFVFVRVVEGIKKPAGLTMPAMGRVRS
jgi:hypothetical protein